MQILLYIRVYAVYAFDVRDIADGMTMYALCDETPFAVINNLNARRRRAGGFQRDRGRIGI